MRFLVDQPVSWRVAQGLCEAGHDAVHVRDLGLGQSSDEDILQRARDESRVIITQDVDFGALLAAAAARDPSVVLLRMSDGRPATQLETLLTQVSALSKELEAGSIVVIGADNVRIRRLPLLRPSEAMDLSRPGV
jgi:predicted nuclease of predicted toxin-antitoxin system